jgi:hypothetical protein
VPTISLTIPLHDPSAAIEQLRTWTETGVRLRPRALTMTMYLRLFLADLFIHGIGGGKYDRLTDHLIQSFFQIPAPGFVVATATFRIPVQRHLVDQNDLRELRRMLREHWYHPERYVVRCPENDANVTEWVQKKSQLIVETKQSRNAHDWHRELAGINEVLRQSLGSQLIQLAAAERQTAEKMRRDQVLASREFPYCAFSEAILRSPLLDLSRQFA